MKSPIRQFAMLLLAANFTTTAAEEPADTRESPNQWDSERGNYVVSFTSSIDPIPINKMHEWILHLRNANGEPVDSAEFSIAGGMPEHNHGLPTSPRITENIGKGDYRVQGVRFHMNGNWQIIISIYQGSQMDRVVIDLQL